MKQKKKRKQKTERTKLKEELDELTKQLVRIRDNWTCQRCGKKVTEQNAHCSHVIPKSKGNALRWDLSNLKLLCFHCHINFWHKNPIEAYKWFKNKFPDRYKYLDKHKNDVVKFSIIYLQTLRDVYKQKLKEVS